MGVCVCAWGGGGGGGGKIAMSMLVKCRAKTFLDVGGLGLPTVTLPAGGRRVLILLILPEAPVVQTHNLATCLAWAYGWVEAALYLRL